MKKIEKYENLSQMVSEKLKFFHRQNKILTDLSNDPPQKKQSCKFSQ